MNSCKETTGFLIIFVKVNCIFVKFECVFVKLKLSKLRTLKFFIVFVKVIFKEIPFCIFTAKNILRYYSLILDYKFIPFSLLLVV